MKDYKCYKYLLLSILFTFLYFSAQGQIDVKMPEHSEDTITISSNGLYFYQNKIYNRYKKLKPLLSHYPESKKLYYNTRLTSLSVAPIIIISIIAYVSIEFKASLDCWNPLGGPPLCENKFEDHPEKLVPIISCGFGIFNLFSSSYKKSKSIRKFNEIVRNTF